MLRKLRQHIRKAESVTLDTANGELAADQGIDLCVGRLGVDLDVGLYRTSTVLRDLRETNKDIELFKG